MQEVYSCFTNSTNDGVNLQEVVQKLAFPSHLSAVSLAHFAMQDKKRDIESDAPLLDIEQGRSEGQPPSCSLEAPSEFSLQCIWSEIL